MFEDRFLVCRDCSREFLFSGGEQQFFAEKGLLNQPKRCHSCRVLMRVQRAGDDPSHTTEVSCANCGALTRVPFQPKGYRPVYCTCCFRAHKLAGSLVAADSGIPVGVQAVPV
jgi:CxxC-x17-CxxC domain-containing protein